MGEDEPLRVPLDPSSLPNVDLRTVDYGIIEEVGQSPEMRILDVRRRMEIASVEAAKAGRLPTMKFVSGYSHYGPKRYDAYEDEVWVGVDVEVPIFDGLRTNHAIRGAQRDAEIARLRYQQTLAEKRARVRELIRRLEAGAERLGLVRDRIEAAEEQVRLANVKLQAERGGLRGAVDAREDRTRVALDAVDADYEQVELWANLQHELGRLAFQVLAPVASAPDSETASATP
jgi:outer membrane protein TolC